MKRFTIYLVIVHLTRLGHQARALSRNGLKLVNLGTPLNDKFCQRNSEMMDQQEETKQDDSIVIAIDSTLTRGGGILILPKTKQMYFYSLDWSKLETITEVSIAHVFNMAVALELFEDFVDKYRNPKKKDEEAGQNQDEQTQSNLFFFTPSQLFTPEEDECESNHTEGTSMKNCKKKYHNFFIELEEKLKSEPFWGNLKQMNIGDDIDSGSYGDSVMKICANLAEENCTFAIGLPKVENNEKFSDYSIENVSDSVAAMLALVSATLMFPK